MITSLGAAPHVLVTGGSGGIGLEIARNAVLDGCLVTVVARSDERLAKAVRNLSGITSAPISSIVADLSSEAGVLGLLAELSEGYPPVDVLVNNAGFGIAGAFADTPAEEIMGMVDLNVRAPIQLTRALLPQMISRTQAGVPAQTGVLNIASVAGLQPAPSFAVYHATKAFVISWSHGIREELKPYGIPVTCVNPGPVPTGFDDRAGIGPKPLRDFANVSAERVGKDAWRGLRRGRATVTPGSVAKFMSVGSKLSPRAVLVAVTGSVYR